MPEHAEVMNVLLSHCKGLLEDSAVESNDGFQVYVIELAGLDFIVEAKRTSRVGYTYIIRSYDRRFKVYTATPRALAISSLIPKAMPVPSVFSTRPLAGLPKPIPRSSTTIDTVSSKKNKT